MRLFKPYLLIFIVVLVFFYPVILQGKLPIPSDALVGLYHPWRDLYAEEYPRGMPFKNFLITDPVRQIIPWRKLAIEQVKESGKPGWNPYSFSGTPLDANNQAAPYYFLNILFFVFSFENAWTLLIILQPILAGVFMYLFLFNRKLSIPAALLGSISFAFSGFMVSWLEWGTIGHALLWLPLILYAIDKISYHSSAFYSWILLFSLISSLTAGHIQTAFYVILFSLFYSIYKLRRISFIVMIFCTVGIFSYILLQPFIANFFYATRIYDNDAWQKEGWFVPVVHLVQFFAPDFFGNPATGNYWGVWNYAELTGYIGVVSMIFAIAAIGYTRKWSIALLGILLLMVQNPISMLPYWFHIPVVSVLQPTRLMGIAGFVFCVLAAYGFDYFLRTIRFPKKSILLSGLIYTGLWVYAAVAGNDVAIRNLIFPTGIFIITVMFIYFRKYVPAIIFVIILSLDILRFAWKFTPFTDPSLFFPMSNSIEFLKQDPDIFRIASVDDRLMPPSVEVYYGLESIAGYDPVNSADYERFIAVMQMGPEVTPPYGFNRIIQPKNITSPLFHLLNVKYVLSLDEVKNPGFEKVFEEGSTKIYINENNLSRAYFVSNVVVKRRDDILSSLSDPKNVAYTEEDVGVHNGQPAGSVIISQYNNNSITLKTDTDREGFLFLSQIFHPGWRAYIDGSQVKIYRTNYIFSGIVVPAGAHTIGLEYN